MVREYLIIPLPANTQQMNQNNRGCGRPERNTSNSHKLSFTVSCRVQTASCVGLATSSLTALGKPKKHSIFIVLFGTMIDLM